MKKPENVEEIICPVNHCNNSKDIYCSSCIPGGLYGAETPHDTPRQESVEEILKTTAEKVTDYGFNDEYGYYNDWKYGVEPILSQALSQAYTQGRASMRAEILAVVPVEWNDITGLEGAEVLHQSIGHNAFRDKLLGKIKDIV